MAAPKLVWDEKALYDLLESEHGPVGRDLERRAQNVEARAVTLCPVDDSRLRGSIDHEVVRDGHGLVAKIGTNVSYAIHVERGTGVFEETIPGVAPSHNKGRRITAKTPGKKLRFEVDGEVFYRLSIAGMRAQPFLRPALDAADD